MTSRPGGPSARPARLQDTVRLSAEGLAKVLGDLEARVMRAVWGLDRPASARDVHDRVVKEHPVALHTVITVLNKLVGKGLLRREKQAGAVFHYSACLSEPEFVAQASRRVVEGILSLGPDAVAASFVDVLAERDPDRLAELMERIRARMEKESGEDDRDG
jgi:predicted transcriptional regulator